MNHAHRSITLPGGFRAAGVACGIKESGKPDLMLLVSDVPCTAAGTFTRNAIVGAAVVVGRRNLVDRGGKGFRAAVCNSGNANVMRIGPDGLADAEAMCRAAAEAAGCEASAVLPASTGIIGRKLPMEKVLAGVADAAGRLEAGAAADRAAADAILTTDLTPKTAVRGVTLPASGTRVTLGGIAKGSGMIAPAMSPPTATMLAFLTTDAAVDPGVLQALLTRATATSFNRISVDSDTSTSDTAYLLASGAAGNPVIDDAGSEDALALAEALGEVCGELAEAIVRDGEGMTKLLRVAVRGAASEEDADRVGRAICDSPLVKCAVHGGDPNWGRFVMAIGKSGAAVDGTRLRVTLGGHAVFTDGVPIDMNDDAEEKLTAALRGDEVRVGVDLRAGDASADWLGCDLSRAYIAINADYRT
ncbi:bifunctional glutamate N-acetyltransferase/amino-acid acetyltransferase ArgJ [Phycisphaera mikurensis]|uniref:Arginine biosynthesis bifunctional protein ArgJ n=1 Tax=Phycisphaera mikurensis (strain NBRC 102666 / KCTC 22515 / FYK2301M01) TaxID=1142394 RepID=I0IIL0_PHYMF|nr:bifunctional glutamate N-acetyltransferase/amino-acid acetyltransferase ArgJ [Phycisphaera mikurensis]MBB6442748.1 glutamate N-acetyltransferase/amino-acid N-acetyltransferase [Phycisphaera mikurensis]BAM05098.1 glutamate N-acetyltransferase/amino-acid acetyltransferase [Phycisphaera mikurensis NBRC 102666]